MPNVLSRAVATWLLGVPVLLWTVSSFAADKSDTPAKDDSDSVFGLTRVWKIHLHVSAENWKAMQPPAGGFPGFGPPAAGGNPGTERKPNDAARTPPAPPGPGTPGGAFRPGSFGYEFEYVKADVELDGKTLRDVGLRLKGNGTYMLSSASRKRPFKIDFNRYVDGQKFHGMQQLNLHNNVMDPTHVRQALSYPVFQTAGVASPRTAFAQVSLTIDGECDHEPLGLYTLVEEIDKAFLRRHFQTDKGLLLKPEGTQGLEYKGEDWAAYSWFEPKSKPKKGEAQRLIDLTRLIHKADDAQFRREISSLLDTDQFASFLAANTLLANMDSFLTQVHNYYIYLPPKSDKFVFLPWDMDLSMGAFFMAGSAEQLQDLSISHPHVGENKLIERLLAWDEFNQTYREHLRKLTEDCLSEKGQTTKSLPIVQAALKELIAQETKRAAEAQAKQGPGGFGPGFGPGPGGPGMFGGQPSLETFLVKRRESILTQLAGKSKGKTPGMSFGPPGGGRPGGGGFGPGNFHAPQILAAADADKDEKLSRKEFLDLSAKWLRDWDKDKNGSLNEEELKNGLNAALGAPPNAAPGGFKPPAGFGPGMFLGPPLLKVADADKDQKVSKDEWAAQFGSWFKQWDKNNDDHLDNAELIAGLNAAFGPPPGQGPPGFGPPRAPDDKPKDNSRSERAAPTPPVELTTQEDHKRLLDLLGIKELRRGANGNDPKAPNAANYDESKVNQDLKLPDPLVLKNGEKVTTAETWKTRRRPELVEDFDREIYGRVPKVTPSIKWEITETNEQKVGDTPVVTKKLVGHVDNSAYPLITVDIQLTLTTPAGAKGPVPVIMEFGFGGFGGRGFGPPPGARSGPTWQEQVIAKGWGYAIIVPNSIQADNGAGLTRGIIGLCNQGQPRKVDDWGALRAWAWGASRALDYFETDKAVDAKRVGIEGMSRYGKAAIVAQAYDERFAIGFIASSGEGGVKLHRRNFGELVENVASSGEYHWMAGNFIKYAGPLTWDDLPVDSHELVALCAPRPVFISAGANGDSWVDAKGMFLAGVGAGPVYKLLGQSDLGTNEFPPQETPLIDGAIAFRQHSGGHTAGPNWPTFLQFADRFFKEPASNE